MVNVNTRVIRKVTSVSIWHCQSHIFTAVTTGKFTNYPFLHSNLKCLQSKILPVVKCVCYSFFVSKYIKNHWLCEVMAELSVVNVFTLMTESSAISSCEMVESLKKWISNLNIQKKNGQCEKVLVVIAGCWLSCTEIVLGYPVQTVLENKLMIIEFISRFI